MGILTDPALSNNGGCVKLLAKHRKKICLLFYVSSLVWFCCMGMTDINHSTYLSENALSPGLVYTEITKDSEKLAKQYHEEFLYEREKHKGMPFAWILAKMKQIGLETHLHNYTLKYPFSAYKHFTGTNIYGILRAPRIGSTEGIVFSAPFRKKDSVENDISASIPILLAFAESSRKKNYWGKDFIFLVTDNEQLGIQAWLEAYHIGGLKNKEGILNSGNLPARAGALQAALNLEIGGLDLDHLNVKIEGLNGGLPNLDYFNLVQRITSKERISSGYKQIAKELRTSSNNKIVNSLRHMISMILTQADCVPTGNHGLFHQYRIEALTLEGIKNKSKQKGAGAISVIKSIEGISRSLNNLLEKFHQSFFFYILVQNDRFVSIGDYMPCAILFVAVFFMKSFFMWHDLHRKVDKWNEKIMEAKLMADFLKINYFKSIFIFACTIVLGFSLHFLLKNHLINEMLTSNLGLSFEYGTALMIILFVLIGFLFPRLFEIDELELRILQIGGQIFMGCLLLTVSLLNFSLGLVLSIIITPLGIINEVEQRGTLKYLSFFYLILCHPVFVIYYFSIGITLQYFENIISVEFFEKTLVAFSNVVSYAVVDNLIYGNFLFPIVSLLLFPAWILMYIVNVKKIELKTVPIELCVH